MHFGALLFDFDGHLSPVLSLLARQRNRELKKEGNGLLSGLMFERCFGECC